MKGRGEDSGRKRALTLGRSFFSPIVLLLVASSSGHQGGRFREMMYPFTAFPPSLLPSAPLLYVTPFLPLVSFSPRGARNSSFSRLTDQRRIRRESE